MRALVASRSKRVLVRASAGALAGALLAGALAGAPALAQELEAQELTSPGGIAFGHLPMPDQESVSIRVAWPSDWSYGEEPVGTPWVGAELLLSGGAGDMSPAEVQQAFEDLQAEGWLEVAADVVYGSLNVRARDLDAAIDIAAVTLADPALDDRWLERIRDGLAANVEAAGQASAPRVGDLLRRLSFGGSGLERFLSLEPPETVTAITREDVLRWHADTLVRTGMTVAVTGGIDADAAGKAVDTLLGGLPTGDAAPSVPEVELDVTPRLVVLQDPALEKSTIASFGWLPPTAEGGEIEDILIQIALGGGDGSRLFETLRTALRASYSAEALLDNRSRALRGLLMYAEVDTDKLVAAHQALRDAYDDFVTDGPTQEEFDGAKAQLAEGLRQMQETPQATAASLVEAALDGQPAARVTGLPAELEAVDLAAVRARLAAVYPPAEELLEVVLTPDGKAIEGACVIGSIDEAQDCDAP